MHTLCVNTEGGEEEVEAQRRMSIKMESESRIVMHSACYHWPVRLGDNGLATLGRASGDGISSSGMALDRWAVPLGAPPPPIFLIPLPPPC